MKQQVNIDPTTVATVWHSMQTICKEMRHLVKRTAQNYLIGQLQDLSVGIWAADGSAVAIPVGLPNQFLGTSFAVQELVKMFDDDIHPGDVFLTNDPYHGGHNTHLPDWGYIRPIFYNGELLFFTLCRGHQMDTGGSFPGGYFPTVTTFMPKDSSFRQSRSSIEVASGRIWSTSSSTTCGSLTVSASTCTR